MLMPSHARNVQLYKDNVPIFARNGVEAQLDAMFLAAGHAEVGRLYRPSNQTEALVSIDVNSGRSTREHSIEDTALNTNLEAAEEISRQLRLRDLAGLIVIDFIDMEEKRNNRSVERKLKDCLRADRAASQVGRISHFGLMEMSRQRIPHGRAGELGRVPARIAAGPAGSLGVVAVPADSAWARGPSPFVTAGTISWSARGRRWRSMWLNQKRRHLADLEERFGPTISISGEAPENGAGFTVERGSPVEDRPERSGAIAMTEMPEPEPDEPIEAIEPEEDEIEVERDADRDTGRGSEGGSEGRDKRRRRRAVAVTATTGTSALMPRLQTTTLRSSRATASPAKASSRCAESKARTRRAARRAGVGADDAVAAVADAGARTVILTRAAPPETVRGSVG